MPAKSKEKTSNTTIIWRISLLILVLGILFTFLVAFYQSHYYETPKEEDLSNVPIADPAAYQYQIDEISDYKTAGNYIYVRGWAAHFGLDLDHFNVRLVLYEDSLKDALVFRVSNEEREDVVEFFDDDYNYLSCGFATNIKSSYIGDTEYKIAIYYNDAPNEEGARLILTDYTLVPFEEESEESEEENEEAAA